MGCGVGLPGLFAYNHGASVTFQDYVSWLMHHTEREKQIRVVCSRLRLKVGVVELQSILLFSLRHFDVFKRKYNNGVFLSCSGLLSFFFCLFFFELDATKFGGKEKRDGKGNKRRNKLKLKTQRHRRERKLCQWRSTTNLPKKVQSPSFVLLLPFTLCAVCSSFRTSPC